MSFVIQRFDWLKTEGNIIIDMALPHNSSNIARPENTHAISLSIRCRFCDATGAVVIVTLT